MSDGAWENCGRVVQVGERCGGVGCGAVEGLFLDEADTGQVFGIVGAGAEERERLSKRERTGNGAGAGGGGGGRRGSGGEWDYEEAAGVEPDLGGGQSDGAGDCREYEHTRWSAISGFNHLGSALAASMSRNSPSVS